MINIQKLSDNFSKIIHNKIFEWFVISIIILSALVVGIKTYEVDLRFQFLIQWLDVFITLFFLAEITVRMLAEKNLVRFFSKGWNIFDFIIVTLSLIPVSESDVALLGRLLRVLRVLRLISFIPELKVLLNAFFKAIPRIGYVSLLMFIIFYIYGAMGSMFFTSINSILWGDIGAAMLTLFQIATFENWSEIMYETMEVYPLSWIYYLSFIFIIAFIFLNMMIGSILETMQEEHQKDIAPCPSPERSPEYALLIEKIERLENQLQIHVQENQIRENTLEKLDSIYEKIINLEVNTQNTQNTQNTISLKDEILQRNQQGESWEAIAKDLNNKGISTPSGKGKWHGSTLARWAKK